LRRTNWAADGGISSTINKKSSLRYEILTQKVRYLRDVLFSFEDLIVSFGGIASLFFGYSFWNSSEMLYYLLQLTAELLLNKFSAKQAACKSRKSKGKVSNTTSSQQHLGP